MKRLALYLYPFFILGILFYSSRNFFYLGAVLSALFFMIYKKKKWLGIFIAAFFIIGITAAYVHGNIYNNKYKIIKSLNILEGFVVEKNRESYIVKNFDCNYRIQLKVYGKKDINAGDYIKFTGEIKNKPYYKNLIMNAYSINAYVNCYNYEIQKTKRNNIITIPIRVKYRIIDKLLSMDNVGGSFICGLIFGYDDDMSYEDRENFNQLGISHILAVSGFNIGIIFYFIKFILRNAPSKLRYSISIIFCLIYTFLSGFQPSIIRAFLLIVLVTTSKILNRMNDSLSILTIAGYIMLIFNSYFIYNAGFLLSFSATYGIIVLDGKIKDIIPEKLKLFKDEISVALSAFLATFPIVIWYNGYISLISVVVNILISPFIALLTVFSFITTIIYVIIKVDFIFYPVLYLGGLFINIVKILTKINLIWTTGRPSLTFIILYYAFIILTFKLVKIKIKNIYLNLIKYLFAFCIIFSLFYHPPLLKIHFLNVGQGDSIFIETPERYSILIDTGPAFMDYCAAKDVVVPYIKRCGYNKINLLILTHMHSDHAGGLEYIIKNFNVDSLLTYKNPEDNKYDFVELSSGDRIKIKDLIIDILYPDAEKDNTLNGNETCLVMNVKYKKYSMLLTADAQRDVMDNILGQFDVVKIPHHGSAESLSYKMLDNSKISTAIISVGKNNFNHPSQKVIKALTERGIKVFRTDEYGNITIETLGEGYKIYFR
ncbi:competence protein ComEC [Caloramator quimbayensis]|uniref:Competence protein ComEC n=1 Tax=Caloramator quimbayensis TaxID=1147123 RepID=A0A1T4XZ19_9CLOT|nr:DNA internalization-related competence protein ComEC/Rec2 [Caloramator quimbayensis]SKA94802.1 competence protein ComEC [Caloramator quimbayensis]